MFSFMPRTLRLSSTLAASPEALWVHATSAAGINYELRPFLRMTLPRGLEGFDARDVQLGTPLFRSMILLFGFLPIDAQHVTLVEFVPGRRFVERHASRACARGVTSARSPRPRAGPRRSPIS